MSPAPRQLAFNFGRDLLRQINLLPRRAAAAVKPRRKATSLRRDPILEEVARMLVKRVGCHRLAKEVCVSWNPRMRTTAGVACYRTRQVVLNPKLIEISAGEVQRTLRHELAHLVAQARAGRRRIAAHGREWLEACADLGIPDEKRCHELPFKTRRLTRRHYYQCPGCETVMARVRRVKSRIACIKCCRKHNGGKYHERFRFREIAEPGDRIAA
ncbi:MAG: SprT-like domain-containing protein [Terrimicrobiaceae bacterium]|nr:SprT-like domain-containing protein [Terrimicrobiaceae bacterium]